MQDEKSEYDKQVEDFLKKTETEFSAKFIAHAKHFDDDTSERDIYEITLKRGSRKYVFTFGNSIICSGKWIIWDNQKGKIFSYEKPIHKAGTQIEKNKKFKEPSAYDVLSVMQKIAIGSFADFCSEFGYDTDSKKAEKMYNATKKEYENLKMLFTDSELEEMQEIKGN